jgi:hypothetical protein
MDPRSGGDRFDPRIIQEFVMIANKQAYEAAYDRALHGRSRPVWEVLLAPFEDVYTRQAREQGERDGSEARVHPSPAGMRA